MLKRPNLAEIAEAAGSSRRQPMPAPVLEPAADTSGRGGAGGSSSPPSRAGTRQVAGHFPEEVAWQLRELAVGQRTTVQDLLGEAMNDLFQKYGKPEIAPVRRKGTR